MSQDKWCFWKKVEEKDAGVSELERSESSLTPAIAAAEGGPAGPSTPPPSARASSRLRNGRRRTRAKPGHRKSAEEAEFTVIGSRSESLLGGELPGTHYFGGCPSPLADNKGKASGHLFYTDAGVNMRFRGILLNGYFRSTATGYPTSPAAKDLRSCARYMYFKDTFMATPAGGVGREWTPMGIGYRQRLDPKDVECVVDGGHVGIQQNARYPDNTASITFMGRPRPLTLKFARYELCRPDFSNPAFNGWGRRTHGMAPQPETIHVFIEDQTLNLTDLEDTRVRVSIGQAPRCGVAAVWPRRSGRPTERTATSKWWPRTWTTCPASATPGRRTTTAA